MWGRVELLSCSTRGQCFACEPTAEVASSRRNSAVHYSTHQVFDQLLADQAILMAAPALLDGCNGLRVRSLNDPHDARLRPFNRHTLEPAAAASRCEPTHPSRSAC